MALAVMMMMIGQNNGANDSNGKLVCSSSCLSVLIANGDYNRWDFLWSKNHWDLQRLRAEPHWAVRAPVLIWMTRVIWMNMTIQMGSFLQVNFIWSWISVLLSLSWGPNDHEHLWICDVPILNQAIIISRKNDQENQWSLYSWIDTCRRRHRHAGVKGFLPHLIPVDVKFQFFESPRSVAL